MMGQLHARFVGGPLHNRHLITQREPCWIVHEAPVFSLVGDCELDDKPVQIVRHQYQLYSFVTDRGTLYEQYVHESLISSTGVNQSTCAEEFPEMPDYMYGAFYFTLLLRGR